MGFDAVKVDLCGGIQQGLNLASADAELHEAIVHNSINRPMLLSVCDYLQPGQYESEVPTLEDLAFNSYTFGRVSATAAHRHRRGRAGRRGFSSVLATSTPTPPSGSGRAGSLERPRLPRSDQGMTAAQFRTQFSMWAMLAAPLMVSEDLISMSSATHTTVTNREAIAIDQDPARQEARLLPPAARRGVVKPLPTARTPWR